MNNSYKRYKRTRNYKPLLPKTNLDNNVITNFSDTQAVVKVKKRSKNGCTNCKKLKIKCNEDKPECEYCIQTGKECFYQVKESKNSSQKANKKKPDNTPTVVENQITSIDNKPLKRLNSISFQLNISKFELQLLKLYVDFGGNFLSVKGVDMISSQFWREEIPKLWSCSDLIKNALYSVTSARLLANYDYDESQEIYIENEDQKSNPLVPYTINLTKQTLRYTKETLELIEMYQLMIDDEALNADETKDILGQILVAKKLCAFSNILLPRPKQNVGLTRLKDSSLVNHMLVANNFIQIFDKYGPMVKNTKFSKVFAPAFIPLKEYIEIYQNMEIFLINHLENYISEKVDASDLLQFTYQTALSKLENACHQTLYFTYTIFLCRSMSYMSIDIDYINLIKKEDHIAMKILFYACCLSAIFHHQSFHWDGVYNEFLEFYVSHSRENFDGEWEDDVDKNIYGWVKARSKYNHRFELSAIEHVGEPVEYFLN
ncbi:unnamed protein product [Wickerhamomyces anomalus]